MENPESQIRHSRRLLRELELMSHCRASIRCGMSVLLAFGSYVNVGKAQQPPARPSSPATSAERALVAQYCVDCHNESEKTAGLALDTISLDEVSKHAETWEKVVRKLRARQMPPEKMPRPAEPVYEAALSSLEASLDRAAGEQPNPGRTDTFRRLNRTEYQNAIRDLLALDVDAVGAAAGRRIESRLRQRDGRRPLADAAGPLHHGGAEDQPAGGRAARVARPAATRSGIRPDLTQEEHVEGLPLGTRGGALIPYTFPQDGEYEIQVRLARDRNEHVEGLRGAARAGGAARPRARARRSR